MRNATVDGAVKKERPQDLIKRWILMMMMTMMMMIVRDEESHSSMDNEFHNGAVP